MKACRALLLILLVVLLPLRAAVAAEMLCAAAQGSAATVGGDAGHDAGLTPGAHLHHGATGPAHGHRGHVATVNPCTVCAALCGMAGPIASIAVPAAVTGAVVFSRLQAPAARFVPERLERPPRPA